MAAWIKVRTDLLTSPKVVRIASALRADRLRTVGGLLSAWCLFDAHSIDGRLSGYDCATLDELIGWPGFASAMVAVEWLEEICDENGAALVLPRFEAHNGQSAKRRAAENDRKKSARMSAKTSAFDADEKRPREDKIRDIKASAGGTPPAAPKRAESAPKPKAKKRAQLPDPFDVSDAMHAWAAERVPGVCLPAETEKFCNYYRAKGEARADWAASWRNWMLNAAEFAKQRGKPSGDGLGLDDLSWRENLGGV